LSRITEAASEGSYSLLGDLWLEALGGALSPSDMLQVFNILRSADREDLALDLMELAVEELENAESPSLPDLLTGAAPVFHRSETLRKSLVEYLRDVHLMFQPLELFLRRSGLSVPEADVSESWEAFNRLMRYRKGGFLYHQNFGPGRITRVSRTAMSVDFQKAPDHEMNLEVALEMTIPVAQDSLTILAWNDPEELVRMFSETPEIVLTRLLDEPFGGEGELSRQDLTPVFGETEIHPADAWKTLKKAAAATARISDLGDRILRRDIETSPSLQIGAILNDRKMPVPEMTRVVQAILGSVSGITTGDREDLLTQVIGLKRSETGALFELAWLVSGSGKLKGFTRGASTFVEKTAARAFRAMGEIHSPSCRRLYLEAFLSGGAAWNDKLQLLSRLKRPMWEHCAAFLEDEDPALLAESLARFLSNPMNTDSFLWALTYCAESERQGDIPSDGEQLDIFLKYLVYAKADTQKRVIGLLLSGMKGELDSYLERSDTRKLINLLESLDGSYTAHREGLHLAVTRELSRRKESAPRTPGDAVHRFWESEYIFSGRTAIQYRLEEMKRLKQVEIPSAEEAIGEAASHGDLSENAEYAAAMERRDLLLARLKRWEDEMERFRPYPAGELSGNMVSPGTRVRLAVADRPDIPERELEIVGPLEGDPEKGRINYQAPLGTLLLGRSPGDEIELPGDSDLLWEVLGIEILEEDGRS